MEKEKQAATEVKKIAQAFIEIFRQDPGVTQTNKGGISGALKKIALDPDKNHITGNIADAVSSGVFARVSDEIDAKYASRKTLYKTPKS